jgi:type II secretion system protein J
MKNIKNRMPIKDCRGFTLSEVLMSVFIFSILSAACYTIMASSSSSWQVNRVRIQLQQELRKSQSWMMHELRQSGASVITDVLANGNPYTTITFRTSTGVSGGSATWTVNTIQFGLNGTQLQRVSGGVTKVLAQNISVFQVRRQAATPDLVEVTLQAQRSVPSSPTITANLSFKVQLRN